MGPQLRQLQAEHGPQVLTIYGQGIASGNATFETEVPSWEQWDRTHLPDCRFVALYEQAVIGWAALSRVSRRAVYCGVAEVSVYVTPAAQGKGLGKELLRQLISCSEDAGIWTLQASLFPENVASLRLHQRCGFHIVGRREKIAQQRGLWRDTLILERRSQRVGLSLG